MGERLMTDREARRHTVPDMFAFLEDAGRKLRAASYELGEQDAREARRYTEDDDGVQSETGAAHAPGGGCPGARRGAD